MIMTKIFSYLRHPSKILIKIDQANIHHFNDKTYLKILYKLRLGQKLNLTNPLSFNEKLQWLKLYDHNPAYVKLVDKYTAKDIVAQTIGKEYIVKTYGLYNSFDDIDFDSLPNKFVIKCTHDSGGLVICKDKHLLDLKAAKAKINSCLETNYYYSSREWPYKYIKPRIIIEEYLDSKKDDLTDYKFMCFNGKVKYIFTCTERFSDDELKVTFFDTTWKVMPFERHYHKSKTPIKKPTNLKTMIRLAEELSQGIPFVRVDFYDENNIIKFGEMTFYPGAGFEEFTPRIWDEKLGELITLPRKKAHAQ